MVQLIYNYSNGVWGSEQKLVASDGATDDRFGISVNINSDGTKVIVGAYTEDEDANGQNLFLAQDPLTSLPIAMGLGIRVQRLWRATGRRVTHSVVVLI